MHFIAQQRIKFKQKTNKKKKCSTTRWDRWVDHIVDESQTNLNKCEDDSVIKAILKRLSTISHHHRTEQNVLIHREYTNDNTIRTALTQSHTHSDAAVCDDRTDRQTDIGAHINTQTLSLWSSPRTTYKHRRVAFAYTVHCTLATRLCLLSSSPSSPSSSLVQVIPIFSTSFDWINAYAASLCVGVISMGRATYTHTHEHKVYAIQHDDNGECATDSVAFMESTVAHRTFNVIQRIAEHYCAHSWALHNHLVYRRV